MEQRKQPGALVPWIVVGTLVALIAAAVLYQRTRTDVPDVALAEDSDKRGAGDRMDPRDGRPLPAGPVAQPLTPEMVKARQQALAQKRVEVQSRVDQTQAAFKSKYASEPVDPSWAGSKEAELAQLANSAQIREIGAEARNLAVDCKSTMCRITADFPNTGAGDDWFTLYMNNVGAKVPMASYKYNRKADGTYSIDVYAVGRN